MASSFGRVAMARVTPVARVARVTCVARLTVAALAGFAGACGGSAFTTGNGDGGSTSDGGIDASETDAGDAGNTSDASGSDAASDAGDGGGAPACPATMTAGAACSQEGLQCEYGTDPNAGCDAIYVCSSGAFKASTQVEQPKTCPTPSFPKENKCPATYNTVPVGQACVDDGLECAYAKGICACAGSNGGPVTTLRWVCPAPGDKCPDDRPRAGSACDAEGRSCSYGACTYRGGVVEKCSGGSWQIEVVACTN